MQLCPEFIFLGRSSLWETIPGLMCTSRIWWSSSFPGSPQLGIPWDSLSSADLGARLPPTRAAKEWKALQCQVVLSWPMGIQYTRASLERPSYPVCLCGSSARGLALVKSRAGQEVLVAFPAHEDLLWYMASAALHRRGLPLCPSEEFSALHYLCTRSRLTLPQKSLFRYSHVGIRVLPRQCSL